mmetsp:Transcript_12858/g.32396  ORF Transcript_12858/g.32396 Transcript_12858/m.32396 type:complete len:206 (-) Transcript_12858:189-806(-)
MLLLYWASGTSDNARSTFRVAGDLIIIWGFPLATTWGSDEKPRVLQSKKELCKMTRLERYPSKEATIMIIGQTENCTNKWAYWMPDSLPTKTETKTTMILHLPTLPNPTRAPNGFHLSTKNIMKPVYCNSPSTLPPWPKNTAILRPNSSRKRVNSHSFCMFPLVTSTAHTTHTICSMRVAISRTQPNEVPLETPLPRQTGSPEPY